MGPDETAGEKARLREEFLARRRARSAADLASARAAVRAHVLPRAEGIERIAAYVPMRTEPGSLELLADLHGRGATVLVPLVLPDRNLDWAAWAPDGGAGEPLGVDAIGSVGLVLAPALAVARDGTRLGRGGGYYDRALARCAPDARVAALLFDGEIVDRLPRDAWDTPVPAAVTPSGWVTLGRNTDVGFAR